MGKVWDEFEEDLKNLIENYSKESIKFGNDRNSIKRFIDDLDSYHSIREEQAEWILEGDTNINTITLEAYVKIKNDIIGKMVDTSIISFNEYRDLISDKKKLHEQIKEYVMNN